MRSIESPRKPFGSDAIARHRCPSVRPEGLSDALHRTPRKPFGSDAIARHSCPNVRPEGLSAAMRCDDENSSKTIEKTLRVWCCDQLHCTTSLRPKGFDDAMRCDAENSSKPIEKPFGSGVAISCIVPSA